MIDMISGIKRKTTAAESTYRFFQTMDLIITHFKREADKEKIFELVSQEANLKDLLVATAAIHIYHNLGIKVSDTLELSQISVESAKKNEIREKKLIFEEVELLLKDSFKLEIDMIRKIIALDNKFIEFLIKERKTKIRENEKEKLIKEIEDQIEQDLIEIIRNYPPFYFYDLIGDLIGLTNDLKMEILEEGSSFKELSVEIERKLVSEEKEDKFIELSTLNRLRSSIQKSFEFKSYKELQTQAMPVRMIKRQIKEHNLDRFPISIPGLESFQDANTLKLELVTKMEDALDKKINFEQFEEEILSFLKDKFYNQLKTTPNDFIYFMENLSENKFHEIIYMLKTYGASNILQLMNYDEELINKIKTNMTRYNLSKTDFMKFNDLTKNLIYSANKVICSLDQPFLRNIVIKCDDLSEEFDLYKILFQDREIFKELWKILEESTGFSIQELREFVRKRDVIDKVFFQGLRLSSYSHILLLLEFEDVINNIAKDLFYYMFSKIIRQVSRIIELFLKVSNDKALYLLAFQKIFGTTESEEWVRIKLEELIIERLIKRQEELVVVFNAMNQPFLVNGFIFARLTDIPLKEGMEDLKKEVSPLYEDVAPLTLMSDIISPISYCISYDLVKRFESFIELRKLKKEQIDESKEKEKEEIKKKLREKQEGSTLNSIERRITTALMRINSPGINPNQLYWQEKDTKITTDNLKLHSELKGNIIDLFSQFFDFAVQKIKSLAPSMKLPDYKKLKNMVLNITNQTLTKRLGHEPSQDEISSMVDGERLEIAKQIASRIGKMLDKALYNKFKSKRRNG